MGLLIGMAPFSLLASSSGASSRITPKLISETFRAYDQCYYSKKSDLYDCDCVAEQFIKARSANPEGDDIDIFIELAQSKCVDTSPIAGEKYIECLKDKTITGTASQREAFCSCVGREAGYEFARTRNLQSPSYIQSMAKAYARCDLPRMIKVE